MSYTDYVERSLNGPIEPSYPELLDYIRKEVLVHPSSEEYNLLGKANPALLSIENSEKFYSNISRTLFRDKYNGFFIEVGALDGETMSNTLRLESEQNWKGLLIEADIKGFETMVLKNRKAWLANACLSPHPYPQKLMFGMRSQYVDKRRLATLGFKMRAMNGLASYIKPKLLFNLWFVPAQCFPLESFLLALRVFEVDLISLDVEGAEWKILKTFPFNKFNVQVIFLEWKDESFFPIIEEFLSKEGYKLYRKFFDDSVFVKKGSPYDVQFTV